MYQDFYGFSEKPFNLTPDPQFFFASKLHNRALSYLKYGIEQGEGFIVITGRIGTGKTTIANNLLASLDDQKIKAIQIVTPKLNPDDLIFMTANKLGLSTDNCTKGQVLSLIENELSRLVSTGYRALLVVDEAQNLPVESVEELRMLSNFQDNGRPLLQSFLLGQPELNQLLQKPNMEQFRQRIVASCDLKPLSQTETKAYIDYRLFAAASKPITLFSDDAIARIYEFTGGTPRRINTLCDRILLFGFLEEKPFIEAETVDTVITEIKLETAHFELDESAQSDDVLSAEQDAENAAQSPTDVTQFVTGQKHQNQNTELPKDIIDDMTYVRNMLSEMRHTLDTSISHKLKVSRYIDNAINRKLKELKDISNTP